MKKNILIIVHTNTWFTEMYRVAEVLMQSEAFVPFVHFAYEYPTLEKDADKLKARGIHFSKVPVNLYSGNSILIKISLISLNLLERILNAVKLRFFTKYFSFGLLVLHAVSKSLQEISYFKKLLISTDASLVVMGGDLVGYNTAEVVRASHLLNKACVIVPSTMSDGTEQAEAYFFDPNFSCERFTNKFAGRLWPKWKKNHKGKWMVRLPAHLIFARQILRTDPPLPWVSSSTRGDAISVESRAMKDYYLRCGIRSELLREAGSPANDGLAHTLRNQKNIRNNLLKELSLDPAKKIILTALPPDFLYMPGGRPECEFANYEKLTKFWIKSLVLADKFNIVISLHPSVNIEEFRYLESASVKISKLSIVDLIPLCDIFVASVSSTIRWAIACGKPVINYDVYLYRYVDFNAVKGVVLLEKSQQYVDTISKINSDPGYLNFLNEEIRSQASYWGTLDGYEGKRILNLFTEEIKKRELK